MDVEAKTVSAPLKPAAAYTYKGPFPDDVALPSVAEVETGAAGRKFAVFEQRAFWEGVQQLGDFINILRGSGERLDKNA